MIKVPFCLIAFAVCCPFECACNGRVSPYATTEMSVIFYRQFFSVLAGHLLNTQVDLTSASSVDRGLQHCLCKAKF